MRPLRALVEDNHTPTKWPTDVFFPLPVNSQQVLRRCHQSNESGTIAKLAPGSSWWKRSVWGLWLTLFQGVPSAEADAKIIRRPCEISRTGSTVNLVNHDAATPGALGQVSQRGTGREVQLLIRWARRGDSQKEQRRLEEGQRLVRDEGESGEKARQWKRRRRCNLIIFWRKLVADNCEPRLWSAE